MKKNIVVCCEELLKAFGRGLRYQNHVDGIGEVFYGVYLVAAPGSPPLERCPWCGKELGFPFEEADAPAS